MKVKIKINQHYWAGLTNSGEPINKDEEFIYERENNSNVFLLNRKSMSQINGDDEKSGVSEPNEFVEKDGFNLFINDIKEVVFNPINIIEPISGKYFHSNGSMFESFKLKVGEIKTIETNWLDAGYTWQITVLEIN
jgi:hypothetical protein